MNIKNVKLLIGFSLMAVNFLVNFALAQSVKSTDTLVYKGKAGIFSRELDYSVTQLSTGVQFYKSGRASFMFDPLSFAWIETTDIDYKPVIETDAKSEQINQLNTEWRAAYDKPPSSACGFVSKNNLSAKHTAKEKVRIKVNDIDMDLDGIRVEITGTWSACQYSGTFKRSMLFIQSLNVIATSESEVFLSNGNAVGSKTGLTLLQVKRSP